MPKQAFKAPVRKPPTYSPREVVALRNGSAVIARAFIMGEWKEQRFETCSLRPSIRDVIAYLQNQIRHHRDFSKLILYVEGVSEGAYLRANIPNDFIPDEVP